MSRRRLPRGQSLRKPVRAEPSIEIGTFRRYSTVDPPLKQRDDYKLDDYKLDDYKLDDYKLDDYKLDDYKLDDYKLDDYKLKVYADNLLSSICGMITKFRSGRKARSAAPLGSCNKTLKLPFASMCSTLPATQPVAT